MIKRGISPKIIAWYQQFLKQRTAFTEIKGITSSVKVQRGCPQGGILSPIIWNCIFESFVELFNGSAASAHCYADDAALVVHGICVSTIVDIMQRELKKAFNWGKKESLIFVASKTNAVFFHRKKKAITPKKLTMDDKTIEYQNEVKYLGVYLDSRLKWKFHIEQKINKAKKSIMHLRNSIGSYWGIVPKILKWGYEGMIIPSLSYGCAVWSRIVQDGKIMKKLLTLNRLMMLTMIPVRRSCPTIGLEVILGISPLDIKIRELALNEMLRIIPHKRTKWDGCGNKGVGHIKYAQTKLQELGVTDYNFDCTKTIQTQQDFTVDLESFKSGLPNSNSQLVCYSDGSKLNQHTGYGLGIFKGSNTVALENGYLGEKNSVFQGEILGIHRACENLMNFQAKKVTIFCDSQSALAALANSKVTSKTVDKCIDNLNQLSLQTEVELKWVKAHVNIPGNEIADKQAKLGTKTEQTKLNVLYQ